MDKTMKTLIIFIRHADKAKKRISATGLKKTIEFAQKKLAPLLPADEQGELCGCGPGGEHRLFSLLWNHLAWRKTRQAEIGRSHIDNCRRCIHRPQPLTRRNKANFL